MIESGMSFKEALLKTTNVVVNGDNLLDMIA